MVAACDKIRAEIGVAHLMLWCCVLVLLLSKDLYQQRACSCPFDLLVNELFIAMRGALWIPLQIKCEHSVLRGGCRGRYVQ